MSRVLSDVNETRLKSGAYTESAALIPSRFNILGILFSPACNVAIVALVEPFS